MKNNHINRLHTLSIGCPSKIKVSLSIWYLSNKVCCQINLASLNLLLNASVYHFKPKGSRNCREAPLNLRFLLNLVIIVCFTISRDCDFWELTYNCIPTILPLALLCSLGNQITKYPLNMYSIFSLLYFVHTVPICRKHLSIIPIPTCWIHTASPLNWF